MLIVPNVKTEDAPAALKVVMLDESRYPSNPKGRIWQRQIGAWLCVYSWCGVYAVVLSSRVISRRIIENFLPCARHFASFPSLCFRCQNTLNAPQKEIRPPPPLSLPTGTTNWHTPSAFWHPPPHLSLTLPLPRRPCPCPARKDRGQLQ